MASAYSSHLLTQVHGAVRSGRWTPQRKAAVLALIERGVLTDVQACARFGIGMDELGSWRRRSTAHGHRGLCVTKLQEVGRG